MPNFWPHLALLPKITRQLVWWYGVIMRLPLVSIVQKQGWIRCLLLRTHSVFSDARNHFEIYALLAFFKCSPLIKNRERCPRLSQNISDAVAILFYLEQSASWKSNLTDNDVKNNVSRRLLVTGKRLDRISRFRVTFRQWKGVFSVEFA